MADFLTWVTKVIGPGPGPGGYEGGLVDNPSDPGGLTNYGIALNEHPELTADDIRSMTRTRAIGIYRQKYWNDLYDQISDQRLANALADFGVTSGPALAVETLQGLIFLHQGPALDGAFGPATLEATQIHMGPWLLTEYTRERLKLYSKRNPEFWDSWFDRTIDALV